MTLTPGTRLGPYEIVALVGTGGMGEVYRARDPRLARNVAIKVLSASFSPVPERLRRFEQEARAAAALNHPNILAIYDVGMHEGAPYLVSELLDGETLHQRLTRGRLDVNGALGIAIDVADALVAAHSRDLIHRDIKPANLFLTHIGSKLLDFGLAKSVAVAAADDKSYDVTRSAGGPMTDAGTIVGTLAHMSPEQLRGDTLDGRTDLFSLGLVLYEMVTGQAAFSGATTAVVTAAILHQAPKAPREIRSDLPPRLDDIVLRLLEKERDLRYQSAADLRADLKRLRREIDSRPEAVVSAPTAAPAQDLSPEPATPPASSDAQLVATLVKRHRGSSAVAALVVVMTFVGGAYWLTHREGPGPTGLDTLHVVQLTNSGNALRPAISPDGKYVVYVQQDGLATSLWIRQIATTSNVQIVPPEPMAVLYGATVTPDGSFVDFVRGLNRFDASLWRVPLLGGTPTRLIDSVSGLVGWSPDGQHMAFVRASVAEGSSALIIADADGSHERVLTVRRTPVEFTWLAVNGASSNVRPLWSADARTVVMAGLDRTPDGTSRTQVVSVDVATGSERTISIPNTGTLLGFAWLGADSLVLNRPADPGGGAQFFRLSYRDGKLSRMTNDLNSFEGASVTADGGTLATGRTDTAVDIWVGDPSTNAGGNVVTRIPLAVAGGFDEYITWAGHRVLYTSTETGHLSIMSVVPGSTTPQEIVAGGVRPAASSDGRFVLFLYPTGGLWKVDGEGRHPVQLVSGQVGWTVVTRDDRSAVFVSRRGGVQSPWIVPIDGGMPVQVTSILATFVDVSPDGKTLVLASRAVQNGGSPTIICALPSCAAQRSLELPRGGAPPHWTPDGRAIAYVDSTAPTNIWIHPLDGSAPSRLTSFTDGRTIVSFAWSHDGQRLAIARATTTNDIVLFKGLNR